MKELTVTGEDTGSTLYAVIRRDSDEKVYSTVTTGWVTYVLANYADYAVSLTETPSGSRFWVGDMPSGAADTVVNAIYYRKAGGSVSVANDELLGNERILASGSTFASPNTVDLISQVEYLAVVDSDADTTKLSFLISAASQRIMKYCGFIFVEETLTEYVNGTGYNFIDLGARPLSLTSLTKDPEDTSPVTYDVSDLSWTEKGRLYFKPSSDFSGFDAGYRNYKVVYTSYGVVPSDLKMACVLLTQQYEFESDQEKWVSEKSVKELKQKWDTSFIGSGDDLGDSVKSILAPYKSLLCI